MKKSLRLISLLLALAMLLSACENSGNSSSQSSADSSKAESSSSEADSSSEVSSGETAEGYAYEAKKDEPETISIYAPWADSLFETWGEDPVSQRITEQTGISFTCVAPVTDDDTKLSLLISSDDLPDVIVSDWNDKNWSAMLQQGMLADLEQAASESAPSCSASL